MDEVMEVTFKLSYQSPNLSKMHTKIWNSFGMFSLFSGANRFASFNMVCLPF